MNDHTGARNASFWISWLSFIIIYCLAISSDYSHFSIDANIHAYNILHWKYNGASDLIIAEGAILYRLIHWLSAAVKPTFILKIWWLLSNVCIICSVGAMLWKLHKCKPACAWSILFLNIGIFALYQLGYFTFWHRLDYCYMALASLATVSLAFLGSPHRLIRIASWLVLLVSLIHIPYARNNAIVTLPLYCLAAVICGTSMSSWWKRISIAMAATLYLCGSMMLLMPIGNKPHACMMISDMKIASILNNEFDVKKSELNSIGYEICSCSDASGENNLQLLCPEAFINSKTDADESALVELYRTEWRRIPQEMAMARAIQAVRFFCTGYVPKWVRSMVAWKYPRMSPDNPAWEWGHDAGADTPVAVYFRPTVYCAAFLLLIWYACRVKRISSIGRAALVTAAISFTYLLSFLVAVPSHDHRYHTPILFGMFCFFTLAMADKIGSGKARVKNDDV